MTCKYFFILSLALSTITAAQNVDELRIPVENDNQFPPDKALNQSESEEGILEGSGAGVIDEPLEATSEPSVPVLEDIQLTSFAELLTPVEAVEHICPQPCVCNIEGNSGNYIVDCSGYELTEFPKPLDSKTTELNLQNNKLTKVPKEISSLKHLKVLNVNSNEIMEIVSGSVSELPELTILKLANNRLIEYPQDLKNGFGLTKLEEIDLAGNDMRTDMTSEMFSNFKSLRKLTLPTSTPELLQDLCVTLKESLETVCTGSCSTKSFDCLDASQNMDDLERSLEFMLPAFIAVGTAPQENIDPIVDAPPAVKVNDENKDQVQNTTSKTALPLDNNVKEIEEFSLRSAIKTGPVAESTSSQAEISSESHATVDEVTVGATTTQTRKGGVDKSVIGIIVAGMVLVVAGITIKKNWSSIRNRFNSSPRAANERVEATTNGTSPEEVPLQEKSPV